MVEAIGNIALKGFFTTKLAKTQLEELIRVADVDRIAKMSLDAKQAVVQPFNTQLFECTLCAQVVHDPVECAGEDCNKWWCKACIDRLKNKQCPSGHGHELKANKPHFQQFRMLKDTEFRCADCDVVFKYEFKQDHAK